MATDLLQIEVDRHLLGLARGLAVGRNTEGPEMSFGRPALAQATHAAAIATLPVHDAHPMIIAVPLPTPAFLLVRAARMAPDASPPSAPEAELALAGRSGRATQKLPVAIATWLEEAAPPAMREHGGHLAIPESFEDPDCPLE